MMSDTTPILPEIASVYTADGRKILDRDNVGNIDNKIYDNLFYQIFDRAQNNSEPIESRFGREIKKHYKVKTWDKYFNLGLYPVGSVITVKTNENGKNLVMVWKQRVSQPLGDEIVPYSNNVQSMGNNGNTGVSFIPLYNQSNKGLADAFREFQAVTNKTLNDELKEKSNMIYTLQDDLRRIQDKWTVDASQIRDTYQKIVDAHISEKDALRNEIIQLKTQIKDLEMDLKNERFRTELKNEFDKKSRKLEENSGGGLSEIIPLIQIASQMMGKNAPAPAVMPQMMGVPNQQMRRPVQNPNQQNYEESETEIVQ